MTWGFDAKGAAGNALSEGQSTKICNGSPYLPSPPAPEVIPAQGQSGRDAGYLKARLGSAADSSRASQTLRSLTSCILEVCE
jgi:hypothetical protein